MHTFKKWMNYIAIVLLDYLVSILVVYLLMYKPDNTPNLFFTLEKGFTSQAVLHICLTIFSLLLGALFFILKRSDNALARKTYKARLVLETGERHISYADLSIWLWSVLLLSVVIGLFVPFYPLSNLLMMGMTWQFGAPPPFVALYDPLVLHQLLVLMVSFQFLRELWRLKQTVRLPALPFSFGKGARAEKAKAKPSENSDSPTSMQTDATVKKNAGVGERSALSMNDDSQEAVVQEIENKPINEQQEDETDSPQ